MQIQILQKNGKFSGFEFFPESIEDNFQFRIMFAQLKNLRGVILKHLIVKELKQESLIARIVE